MTKKKVVKKKLSFKMIVLIKIAIIGFLLFGFFYSEASKEEEFSNTVGLLAVNEDSNGAIVGGSLINLELTITPGTGKISLDLESIKDIDTQISIINSQDIACELFNLPCSQYNFHYSFDDSSLLLKGPSASSAIALLVAKTLQKETLTKTATITGSLNSGGLIGIVGGVDEKIQLAQQQGFSKVLIPKFSEYNATKEVDIEVYEVQDIIEAYNIFTNSNKNLKQELIESENYAMLMKQLAQELCSRANESFATTTNIKNTSPSYTYLTQAQSSFNYSQISAKQEDYYSSASFCYNSNINLAMVKNIRKNNSLEQIKSQAKDLEQEVNLKLVELNSDEFKQKITTMNEFYVYLLLQDRVDEAKELLKVLLEEPQKNPLEEISNTIKENSTNSTQVQQPSLQQLMSYSTAKERFYTVKVWEEFLNKEGREIDLSHKKITSTCEAISKQVSIKQELLSSYTIEVFNEEAQKQQELSNPFNNQFLCIYQGLETIGKMNTILNSFGITNSQQENYTKSIMEFTQKRITLNQQGDFPLIPFIYSEYAQNLATNGDYSSASLYSNYALAYSDLNLYLEKEETSNNREIRSYLGELFSNPLFIGSILVILGFLS